MFPRRTSFLLFLRDRHTLRPFFSDWLMLKIVECDWLMDLCGMGYRFDKTNNYKRIKRNNDGKCWLMKMQWKTVKSKLFAIFFRSRTISFKQTSQCKIIMSFFYQTRRVGFILIFRATATCLYWFTRKIGGKLHSWTCICPGKVPPMLGAAPSKKSTQFLSRVDGPDWPIVVYLCHV